MPNGITVVPSMTESQYSRKTAHTVCLFLMGFAKLVSVFHTLSPEKQEHLHTGGRDGIESLGHSGCLQVQRRPGRAGGGRCVVSQFFFLSSSSWKIQLALT